MRARLLSLALFAVVATLAVASSCGYDPQPESGTLQCGPQSSCPENYSCMNGHCYRNGAAGSTGHAGTSGGAGSSGTMGGGGRGGGSGGTGGSSATDKFLGVWSFVSTSTRMIVCTDGFTENKRWDGLGEQFEIIAGPVTALATHYYCDWDLDIAASGTSTVIKSGESCSAPDPNVAGTMYTWHGMAFTLTTSNGRDGTLAADIPYDYVTSTGSGSCTMHFTGTMRKN